MGSKDPAFLGLRLGSRASFRAMEALRVLDALSCYLSLIFKHSDTKWDTKNIVDQILGGGVPDAPPLNPALELLHAL